MRDLLVALGRSRRASPMPDIAAEGERERLTALAGRFSREDLMRAFDVLTRAEHDIRDLRRSRAITSRWRCCD